MPNTGTQADTYRRLLTDIKSPLYWPLMQLIERDSGQFGLASYWTKWNSPTIPTNQIQNLNSATDTPARWSKDDAGALIWEELKSGVNAGKPLTGQAGGVFYPTLISKASASGTVNFDASSAGVVTRPLLKNWNGTTTYFQSDATEGLFQPQIRGTNGTIDFLTANATELLVRPKLRNWNGTIDYLVSDSTELLARPKLRVWDGTNAFLTVDSAEALIRTKARVWDGSSVAFLTSDSTELLVRPKFRLWDGTTDFLTGDTATGALTFGGTARRIVADMVNATHLNRLLFQGSTVNGATVVGCIPNGTGTTSGWTTYNAANADAAGVGLVSSQAAEFKIQSTATGGATAQPMTFYHSTTKRFEIGATGIGFFGVAQVARPDVAGVTTGTLAQLQAVVRDVLLDLEALGLITDSTT